MSPADIQTLLPVGLTFADTSYARPTLAWLTGPFWRSFAADRWAKVGRYTRTNDCDNWARAYAQHAQDCHARTATHPDEALAVGEFFYTRADGLGAHAIAVAITDTGLTFLEPQNGTVLPLTPAEIASCTFARF